MTLTPSDVEQKTFGTALRGYDVDEVDDFLDEVVATIRLLQKAPPPAAPAGGVVEPASAGGADESAVGRALITAQETASALVVDAQMQADQILAGAKAEAEAWSGERDAKKTEVDAEIAELARLVADVRAKLQALAAAASDRVDEMGEALSSARPPGEAEAEA